MRRTPKIRLGYDRLEPRQLLAGDFALAVDHSSITLDSFTDGQVVSIFQQDERHIFYLPGGVWNGVDQLGISGNGTSFLTIDYSEFDEIRTTLLSNIDSAATDVVFAGDVELSRFRTDEFRSVSQSPGTSVSLIDNSSLRADSIVMEAPGNYFESLAVTADYLFLHSEQIIRLTGVGSGYGNITSTQSISVGRGALIVSDHLTISSDAGVSIASNVLGVTGRLSLIAPERITLRSHNFYYEDSSSIYNGQSIINQLNFQSDGVVTIQVNETQAPFEDTSLSLMNFVGNNRASDLYVDGQNEKISSLPGTSIVVENHAYIAGRGSIYLAANAGDVLHIGKRAHFEARPVVVKYTVVPYVATAGSLNILRAGDVRFGWFRSNQSTYVTVFEDDSSYLTSIGGQRSAGHGTDLIFYTSGGDLETYSNAQIESDFTLELVAQGRLSARTSDNVFSANSTTLIAGEIAVDHIRSERINFRSTGNVQIRADSDILMTRENTGRFVDLRANRVGNIPGASLQADNLYALADSVWLANDATSEMTIKGRATFDVPTGYIVIGRLGSVQMGQLSFNTNFAEIRLSGRMQLAGSVRADDVVLSSSSFIGDSPTADIRIQRNATFRTPRGVYLANGLPSQNFVSFCGHVFFDADQFAIVNESGFARIGSWSVKPGAFQSISVDSRTCET